MRIMGNGRRGGGEKEGNWEKKIYSSIKPNKDKRKKYYQHWDINTEEIPGFLVTTKFPNEETKYLTVIKGKKGWFGLIVWEEQIHHGEGQEAGYEVTVYIVSSVMKQRAKNYGALSTFSFSFSHWPPCPRDGNTYPVCLSSGPIPSVKPLWKYFPSHPKSLGIIRLVIYSYTQSTFAKLIYNFSRSFGMYLIQSNYCWKCMFHGHNWKYLHRQRHFSVLYIC